MIKPSVGRIVWFYPHVDDGRDPNGQPLAATIAKVIDDRVINLTVSAADGSTFGAQHVTLAQPGDLVETNAAHATWMPFQVGQAAKTEQLQAAAAAPVDLGPLHSKLAELEKLTEGKFGDLGAWLQKTVKDIHVRLAAIESPAQPTDVPPIGKPAEASS